jgi:hypothetical protein
MLSANLPTLRVAAPVLAPDGKAFGIMIINIDMRPAFATIRAAGGNHDETI